MKLLIDQNMSPKLVEQLPGYVETAALDVTGAKDDQRFKICAHERSRVC
jgi:predicted nuclease of predicted toxin-antitoxin system